MVPGGCFAQLRGSSRLLPQLFGLVLQHRPQTTPKPGTPTQVHVLCPKCPNVLCPNLFPLFFFSNCQETNSCIAYFNNELLQQLDIGFSVAGCIFLTSLFDFSVAGATDCWEGPARSRFLFLSSSTLLFFRPRASESVCLSLKTHTVNI